MDTHQNEEICDRVIRELESGGFRAAFFPYLHSARIGEAYDALPEHSKATPFIQDAVRRFHNHQPPDIPFEPLSILIVAYASEPAQIILRADGRSIAVPIPPTYLDDPDRRQRLHEILSCASQDCQTAHTSGISQKLLAVLSGLGRYGRNNICYIEGLGSFFNLNALYTDIPCGGVSFPLRFLEECETCGLCRDHCPTGAIGGHSVIDATRCLTMYNERKEQLPDWLPPSAHHALIGCFRCQEICPLNQPLIGKTARSLALDEAETHDLLTLDSAALPPELELKLKRFGIDAFSMAVAVRNVRLAVGTYD